MGQALQSRLPQAHRSPTRAAKLLDHSTKSLATAHTGIQSLARIPQLLLEARSSVQIRLPSKVSHFKQTMSLDHCLLSGQIIFSLSAQPGLDKK